MEEFLIVEEVAARLKCEVQGWVTDAPALETVELDGGGRIVRPAQAA